MINTENFDSRALRYTDAFGQRFMRKGTYHFSLVTAGIGKAGEHALYTINVEVAKKDHKMVQHSVQVLYKDEEFVPDEAEITIVAGDLVMWSCRETTAPPFEVVGDKEFFNSADMVNECGYAHAFCAPGEYHWSDANGSKLCGVVQVSDPDCQTQNDLGKWQKKLTKGALVMINGAKAEPDKIKILTGQTVYFAIIKSEGISITDQNCIDGSKIVHDALEAYICCRD